MDKPDFKLSQIGNVMLGVRDLARSVTFYRDTLSLAVRVEIPGSFAFLDGGGVYAVSEPAAGPGEPGGRRRH